MEKRRREVLRHGIPVLEESAATSLLVDDGRVVGATVLDYRRGHVIVVLAGATILATGHSDYLAARATATREQSADGIAMAIRIGAEMANLEMQWWHVSDMAYPRTWMRMHLYPNPLLGTTESSRLYNSEGEVFYEQKTHSPASSAPYVEQARRLAQEVQRGRARWDGGYYSGYDHIPADVIKAYQRQAKVWEKLGLDVGRDRLRRHHLAHALGRDQPRPETCGRASRPLRGRRHRVSLSRRGGAGELRRQGGNHRRGRGGGPRGTCTPAGAGGGGSGADIRLPPHGRRAVRSGEAEHP
jgi:succinate dehydrogenase/fumarate reductase flavoprotein subunit